MKEIRIQRLIEDRKIKPRSIDIPRARSLIEAAERTARTAEQIPLNEFSATTILRETYEALHELGDAKWWSLGYEAQTHEASMDILKDEEPVELVKLDRFRTLRNDANYRGVKITVEQAKEILDFWKKFGPFLLKRIKESVKKGESR